MAAQALMGLTAPEQYRDVEWIKATWVGNDWLTLVVAVPLLLISSNGYPRFKSGFDTAISLIIPSARKLPGRMTRSVA
jgi:hypothetical protein